MPRQTDRAAVISRQFLADLRYWIDTDCKSTPCALELVEAVLADPFNGIGKPEPLRFDLAGGWSRRITQEDRLVYRVTAGHVDSLQARYHYE